jgi:hypothetical protein
MKTNFKVDQANIQSFMDQIDNFMANKQASLSHKYGFDFQGERPLISKEQKYKWKPQSFTQLPHDAFPCSPMFKKPIAKRFAAKENF